MRIQSKFQILGGVLVMMLLASSQLFAQKITLVNSSFEDNPIHSSTPTGWRNCGDKNESPPDIQPGNFEVTQKPFAGKTYLGLVTRDNDTWEGVGQRLSSRFKAGSSYKFDVYLAKSAQYISPSRVTGKETNFSEPVRLRVWGGSNYCSKQELLVETSTINHTGWKKYELQFTPKAAHAYIYFEAYYKRGAIFPYNGNILIDNISPLVTDEEEEEVIANVEVKVVDEDTKQPIKGAKLRMINNNTRKTTFKSSASTNLYIWRNLRLSNAYTITASKDGYETKSKSFNTRGLGKSKTFEFIIELSPIKEEPPVVVEPVDPKPDEPTGGEDLIEISDNSTVIDRNKVKKGTILRTEGIQFAADAYELKTTSYKVLDGIYQLLSNNPDIKIEVGGHTNNIPDDDYCDRLSTQRAKAVADYLVKKGITSSRITYKGYGKRNPIATNETKAGRRKNQRVDIQIISINK